MTELGGVCGCPGVAVLAGGRVWHTHPVTCTGCGVLLRYVFVTSAGLHLCPPCVREG